MKLPTAGFVLLGMVDFVLGGALSRRNVSIPHDLSRGERLGCAEGQRGSRGGQVAFEFTGVALYYTAPTIPNFTANVSLDGESQSISSIPDGNSNQPGQTQPQVSWTDLENRRHEVHISYSCADLASEGDTVDPPECVPFESLIYTEECLMPGPDYQQPDAATASYITIQSSCPHSSNSHSSNSQSGTLQAHLHQPRSLEKRSLSKTKILIIALGISGGILFLFFLCFVQLWRARRKDKKMEREAAKLAAAGGGAIGTGAGMGTGIGTGMGMGGRGVDFKVAGSDTSGTDSGRGSKVLQDPNGHFGAGREAGGYGPGYGYGQGQGPIGMGRPGGYGANSGYYTNGEYPSNGMDAEKGLLPVPPPPAAGKRLKKSKYETHKYYRSASDEINMAFMSPHLQPEPFSQGL
ncbi:hypothetical protein CC2G_009897 [Coprinopsis cinerea AmutBmut pab1-1]|nr:hypothetical protein CC2G_009897 [Coprinopsis cinerea AmutBmut pab1-1]